MSNQYQKLIEATASPATVKGYTHNFYRYPARFSDQFAKEVITTFSKPGEQIIDPFMGGGTAIVEALASGRSAVGIDLNELAHFVTTVKTTPLSENDEETISRWLDSADEYETGATDQLKDRVVNLPPHIQRLFGRWLSKIDVLPLSRQRNFVRCALLKTGQSAIDCKTAIPSYSEIRITLRNNIALMFRGLNELVGVCGTNGIAKNRITAMRTLICRSAVGIESEAFWANGESRPRLVVTSAPYWIANLNDGNGLSYYTFGSRRTQLGFVRYFETLLKSFKSLKQVLDPKATKLGRLLIFQSGATLFRSCISLFGSLFCWGAALLILLSEFGQESDVFPLTLVSVGIIFLLAFLFGYLKSVRCYERGVVIRNIWKSRSISFSDIVAIQYLAVHKYTNGMFDGTLCHFEVIPYVEDAIRVRILGSKRDSNRLWNMVEIILRSNPDAKLLEWN